MTARAHLAAVEASARLWGSGLASATVKPDNLALQAITPTILDSIGRNLCRVGECLFMIDVRQGKVSLTPCGQWTVHGNDDPGSVGFISAYPFSGPDSTRMITLPSEIQFCTISGIPLIQLPDLGPEDHP